MIKAKTNNIMITEIKFIAGADASVIAKVIKKKPTKKEIEVLDNKWAAHGGTYAEWPVKKISYAPRDIVAFDIELWTGETITVFTPNYIRWHEDKSVTR